MKKQATFALILILVVVAVLARINSGPSLETQLTEYFSAADQAVAEMNALRDELDAEVDGIETKVMSGTFEAKIMKQQLKEFQQRTKGVRKRLTTLTPPPEADEHKKAILGRCDTFSELLKQTVPVIDVAKTTANAIEQLTTDPARSNGVLEDLDAAQKTAMVVQERTSKLTAKGIELERQAQAERERLIKEYDLKFSSSRTN